uniref:Uncharacterized protein n=1 Tax=Planktothricoides sp. SpSt-374 TaxID=2282167 RepID=A0A7C3ZLE2_9CYAN
MRGWGKIGIVSPTRCVAMDEQRVQTYLSLIQQLLACPSGEGQAAFDGTLANRHQIKSFLDCCE